MILETENVAKSVFVTGVFFEEWNEKRRMFGTTLKRLKNDVENAIWIKVEAA